MTGSRIRFGANDLKLSDLTQAGKAMEARQFMERGSGTDFMLPVAVSRLLVKLGITLEFKFDP